MNNRIIPSGGASLLLVCLLAVTLASGCASALLHFALQPANPRAGADPEQTLIWLESRSSGCAQWYRQARESGSLRDTFILSDDGTRLHALYCKALTDSRKTAVIVHGYTSAPEGMSMIGRMYRDSLGYNILMPSLRRHGKSEGREVQMGWHDRLDVKRWCSVAHETFDDTLQVCHGISMGGATVMMLSGEPDLPRYVRGIIDDCGYTSVWDEFSMLLRDSMKIRDTTILVRADKLCQKRYGWGFKEASSIDMVSKSSVPMLFIHGDADNYVPVWMGQKCYEAKTEGYRELWLPEGARHAASYTRYPAEYTARVRKFLAERVE